MTIISLKSWLIKYWNDHVNLVYVFFQPLDIYRLDSTDVSKWDENVLNPAEKVLDAIISDDDIPLDTVKIDNNYSELALSTTERG